MRNVREIPLVRNIPVLVRAPLNVPIAGGKVASTYRLSRALPTLTYLRGQGARMVIASHIGEEGTETLAPVAKALGDMLGGVAFCEESIGARARSAARALHPGEILVLENLRRHKGETANDPAFATELAALADVFVQDSFDTCHREHASIVGVPKLLPSYAGLLLEEEIDHLAKALTPAAPSLAIVGGAKFSTKVPVLEKLFSSYGQVFVGGALANDFFKAKGYSLGASLTGQGNENLVKKMLEDKKLLLPRDARVVNKAKELRVAAFTDIRVDEYIVDHGPATSAFLAEVVAKSKSILWNGTLGQYENGYAEATDALARAIASSSAYSIVGGGDTGTELEKIGLMSRFSFVSTGGGAMLEYLARGALPGITALG